MIDSEGFTTPNSSLRKWLGHKTNYFGPPTRYGAVAFLALVFKLQAGLDTLGAVDTGDISSRAHVILYAF